MLPFEGSSRLVREKLWKAAGSLLSTLPPPALLPSSPAHEHQAPSISGAVTPPFRCTPYVLYNLSYTLLQAQHRFSRIYHPHLAIP